MDEIRTTAQKEQQLLKAQYATLAAELEDARQAAVAAEAVGEQADAAQQRSAEMEAQVSAAAAAAAAARAAADLGVCCCCCFFYGWSASLAFAAILTLKQMRLPATTLPLALSHWPMNGWLKLIIDSPRSFFPTAAAGVCARGDAAGAG